MRFAPLALTKADRRSTGRRRFAELLAFGGCLAAASAFAASLQIAQKHRAFSRTEITIQRGDTIAFSNDDEIPASNLCRLEVDELRFGGAGTGTDDQRALCAARNLSGPLPYPSENAVDRARPITRRAGLLGAAG